MITRHLGTLGSGRNGSSVECLLFGDSSNGIFNYNFLTGCPYGIATKAYGTSNSSGVISYNCFLNCFLSTTVKGVENTNIFNNTYVANDSSSNDWYTFIDIEASDDLTKYSTGTIIKNNIFYSNTTNTTNMIIIDQTCLTGFVCDYNIYYDVNNSGLQFQVSVDNGDSGSTTYDWTGWRALGYDSHSIIVNPNLNLSTLIPSSALNYASNLGSSYNTGISTSNVWNTTNTITQTQRATWQNGAFII